MRESWAKKETETVSRSILFGAPVMRGTLRPRAWRAETRSRKTKEVKVCEGGRQRQLRSYAARRWTYHSLIPLTCTSIGKLPSEDKEHSEDDESGRESYSGEQALAEDGRRLGAGWPTHDIAVYRIDTERSVKEDESGGRTGRRRASEAHWAGGPARGRARSAWTIF